MERVTADPHDRYTPYTDDAAHGDGALTGRTSNVGGRRVEIQLGMRMLTETATTPVPTRLRYCADEPYAVMLVFASRAANPIEWIFARDMLARGLTQPSGEGDVRIWPADNTGQVFLELRSPTGQALFAANAARVRWFLARTEDLVPPGTEGAVLDLDHALGLLLNGDPGIAPA